MARTLVPPGLGAVAILGLLLVSGAATGALGPSGRPDPVAGAGPLPARAPLSSATSPSPAVGPIGPIGGRLFDVESGLPSGATNSVTGLAVDPTTGLVYAANEFAATVTVFNETTGAVVQVQPVGSFATGSYPAGLLLDPAGHRLFVSISTRFGTPGAGGWVLVLNESTLATEANISFPGAPEPPFEPTYIAYDPPTDQAFVENATKGIVAEIDLATNSATGYLVCPMAGCAEHPYGLVDVPQYHTLVVPTCAKSLWLVNTSNDSTRALISGPSNGALMAWTAFDSADQIMWVENYSYYGAVGNFLGYNLSTLALVASAPGAPARESGMLYDAALNLLVTTNIDASEAIETYNATTGLLVASSKAANATGEPFLAVAVDPRTGEAIAGGPGNDTTIGFRLPSLEIARAYSSFPLTQTAITTDPDDGTSLLTTVSPTTLAAQNESTGAPDWTEPLRSGADPVGVAFDAVNGMVYVADSGSASLLAYAAVGGAYQAAYPLGTTPSGLCALAIDPVKGLLYVGSTSPAEIVAFNVTMGSVVGTFALTGYSPCRLSVDPTNHELFVLATPGTTGLFVLAPDPGGLLTERASWAVPASAVDLVVGPTGTAYVLADGGSELASLASPSGTLTATLNLSSSPASTVALDPTDGLLFLSAAFAPELEVVRLASLTFGGALGSPNVLGPLAVDPVSDTVVAATVTTGQSMEAALVAVPSAPTGLTLTPGNQSATAMWQPPASSGADPVAGYLVEATPTHAEVPTVVENVTNLSATVIGLVNGVAYNLTVAAVSTAGAGTSVATATVTPAGLPFPPTGLAVNGTTTTSITIHWSPPVNDDGASVTGYFVHCTPTAGGPVESIDAQNATDLVVGALTPDTEYSLAVFAVSAGGFSHGSLSVNATTGARATSVSTWVWVAAGGSVLVLAASAILLARRNRPTASSPPEIARSDPPAAPDGVDASGDPVT